MEMMLFGLVLFLGTHSISIVNAPWRDRVAARLGEFSWQAIYAVFAVAGFILIIWGYGLARQAPEVTALSIFPSSSCRYHVESSSPSSPRSSTALPFTA